MLSNFFKSLLKSLRFSKLSVLLNKMGSLDWEDLSTSRLQLCKRDKVVRCVLYFLHHAVQFYTVKPEV
jgi:hypothetical protein